MEDRDFKELESAVESILFASGEPVRTERICFALSLERGDAERVLRRLQDYYAFERRGMRLLQLEDRWQLCSSPDHADAVRKAFEIRKPAKLSQPALEALTIIAYYQPTTRAYVDKLRGVDSSYTVSLLLERGLIETCGHLQAPGRPLLYRTTEKFLRSFHLSSLEELPPLNAEDAPPEQMKIEELARNMTEPEAVATETAEAEAVETVETPEAETVETPEAEAVETPEAEAVETPEVVETVEAVEAETVEAAEVVETVEAAEVVETVEAAEVVETVEAVEAETVEAAEVVETVEAVEVETVEAAEVVETVETVEAEAVETPEIVETVETPEVVETVEAVEAEAAPILSVRELMSTGGRPRILTTLPARKSRKRTARKRLAGTFCVRKRKRRKNRTTRKAAPPSTQTVAVEKPSAPPRRRLSGKAVRRCFRCLLCGFWVSWPWLSPYF